MCLPLLLSSKTALVTNLLTPSTSMVVVASGAFVGTAISLTQQPHFNTMLASPTSSTPTRLCSTGRQTSDDAWTPGLFGGGSYGLLLVGSANKKIAMHQSRAVMASMSTNTRLGGWLRRSTLFGRNGDTPVPKPGRTWRPTLSMIHNFLKTSRRKAHCSG